MHAISYLPWKVKQKKQKKKKRDLVFLSELICCVYKYQYKPLLFLIAGIMTLKEGQGDWN